VTDLLSEPVVGWRLWQVRPHADGHRLESFTAHHVTWPCGRRLEAGCAVHGTDAPAREHECGIYAFRTHELAEELLRRYVGIRQRYGRDDELPPPPRPARPIALGRVSLWGRILEREHGFRAQYAYPYEVILLGGDDAIARELRRLYAVDVVIA
jgi:hypothetical protein